MLFRSRIQLLAAASLLWACTGTAEHHIAQLDAAQILSDGRVQAVFRTTGKAQKGPSSIRGILGGVRAQTGSALSSEELTTEIEEFLAAASAVVAWQGPDGLIWVFAKWRGRLRSLSAALCSRRAKLLMGNLPTTTVPAPNSSEEGVLADRIAQSVAGTPRDLLSSLHGAFLDTSAGLGDNHTVRAALLLVARRIAKETQRPQKHESAALPHELAWQADMNVRLYREGLATVRYIQARLPDAEGKRLGTVEALTLLAVLEAMTPAIEAHGSQQIREEVALLAQQLRVASEIAK